MEATRPNILMITTDQHRADSLGIAGHPVLQTPYLDRLASTGIRFTSAYSACPICIPARRTLLSGQKASEHGVLTNVHKPLEGPTLPGELTSVGYQTHLVGKLHLYPERKSYGFQGTDWSDSPSPSARRDDYERYLNDHGIAGRDVMAHRINQNGWVVRPWHLEEKYHFSNWCADRALEFLERRDPTRPFFLNVSFFHPHQPLMPPRTYFDRYRDTELPPPNIASGIETAASFTGLYKINRRSPCGSVD